MNANSILLMTLLMVVPGCHRRSHEFTVSTELNVMHLMDVKDRDGQILVYDSSGMVGEVKHIRLAIDNAAELLIATDRTEFSADSLISRNAKLRADGTVLLDKDER